MATNSQTLLLEVSETSNIMPTSNSLFETQSDFTAKLILYYTESYDDFTNLACTNKRMYSLSQDEALLKEIIVDTIPNFLNYKSSFQISWSKYHKLLNLYIFYLNLLDNRIDVKNRSYFAKFLVQFGEKIDLDILFSRKFISEYYNDYNEKNYQKDCYNLRYLFQQMFQSYCEEKNVAVVCKFLDTEETLPFSLFGYYMDYFAKTSFEFQVVICRKAKNLKQILMHIFKFKTDSTTLPNIVTNLCERVNFELHNENSKEIIPCYLGSERYDDLIWLLKKYKIDISTVMTNYLLSFTYDTGDDIALTMLFIKGYNISLNFDILLQTDETACVNRILKYCRAAKIEIDKKIFSKYP